MEKKILSSERIPAAGPYSAAVEAGGFIFLSGQLPLHPQTGEAIIDIQAATRQVLKNICALLEEKGLSLKDIVKTTIFLKDIADFPSFNEVYAGFFPDNQPARSTIAVAALPKGAPLEIEAIAARRT